MSTATRAAPPPAWPWPATGTRSPCGSRTGGGAAGAPAGGTRCRLGVGIPGMRERLRQLGGQLALASTPHGTTVIATIPVGARRVG